MRQKFFDYNFPSKLNLEDFYVSKSNIDAYNYVINKNLFINYTIINGPKKSGKTHLGLIWLKRNNAIIYEKNNYEIILESKKNIFIDNFLDQINEEYLFYIINHCFNNNLRILFTTDIN